MPVISKITLPSGGTYDIKDSTAREAIASLSGGSYFLGVSETPITDQSTTSPIYINGEYVYPVNGNMAIYGNKEFVWSTTQYLYYSKQLTTDTPPKYYYTLIASPTQAQKDAAVFTTSRSIPTTSSGAISEPLADGADIIKAQYSGKWVEFGDLSSLGDLATKDAVNVASSIVTSGHTVQAAVVANATTTTIGSSEIYPITGTSDAISGVVATKKKLVTTKIKATSGTETVIKSLTPTSKKLATTGASVPLPGWSFTVGDNETLVVSGGNNSGTPYTFYYATGGLVNPSSQDDPTVIASLSSESATVATRDSSFTEVATGYLAELNASVNVGAIIAVDAAASGSPVTVGTIASGTNKIKVGTVSNDTTTVVTGLGTAATVLKSDATINNTVTYTDHNAD